MVKVAHYFYNDYGKKFCAHIPKSIEFIDNTCDKDTDLIYCGTTARLADAFRAKLLFNKPIVCWVWDIPYNWKEWAMTFEEQSFNPLDSHQNLLSIIDALKQCDLVISASKYTQNVLWEKFQVVSDQVYFYVDIDLDLIPSPVKSNEKSIIQVSRIVPHKRFEISIDAVQELNIPLICVGISKNELYFKKLQAHAKHNVTFLHNINRDQVIIELMKATVLVSPSVFEGWGLSPIEAITCGTPVILNDMPVFREVYGDAAIYHKQDDVNDLREKLVMLLSDKYLQKKVVEDCKQIIAPFTPKLFAKRWMNLLFS